MRKPPLKRTYTVGETAAILDVDRSTVYRLIGRGELDERTVEEGRRVWGQSIWQLCKRVRRRERQRAWADGRSREQSGGNRFDSAEF